MNGAQLLDAALEALTVVEGAVLDARPIVIDRVHAIVQELGDLRGVFDAQTDQCEDADLRGQAVLFFRMYLHVGLQKGIEVVDEVGEEMQEHGVEVLIELLQLALFQLSRL